MYLRHFDYQIVYRKGLSLNPVDDLSRNPVTVLRTSRHDSWLHIEQKGNAEKN
jgi:hypothetical protein